MFHVELRRFPHVARAFNLSAEEVGTRIVEPLARGAAVELDDRSFTAEKTRVTIYEGPAIAAEDRGLGRGWALVTKSGSDVTAALLDAARDRHRASGSSEGLKHQLLRAVDETGLALPDAVAMAARALPGRRASEALALGERAVWELLHAGSLALLREGSEVAPEEWEQVLLAWRSWRDPHQPH